MPQLGGGGVQDPDQGLKKGDSLFVHGLLNDIKIVFNCRERKFLTSICPLGDRTRHFPSPTDDEPRDKPSKWPTGHHRGTAARRQRHSDLNSRHTTAHCQRAWGHAMQVWESEANVLVPLVARATRPRDRRGTGTGQAQTLRPPRGHSCPAFPGPPANPQGGDRPGCVAPRATGDRGRAPTRHSPKATSPPPGAGDTGSLTFGPGALGLGLHMGLEAGSLELDSDGFLLRLST